MLDLAARVRKARSFCQRSNVSLAVPALVLPLAAINFNNCSIILKWKKA